MADLVHYIGSADGFTPKQKAEKMNAVCLDMEAEGYRLIAAVPDQGGDGITVGIWLFFGAGAGREDVPGYLSAQTAPASPLASSGS